MRILFIGCVESSYIELEILLKYKKSIVGVITKKKSTLNADFVDLQILAQKYGLPCKYVDNVNDENSIDFIKECNPDVIYCLGWSQIIKKEILDIPRLGIIGTHPAELPQNRGRHPIIWALALGLEKTASTFFKMNEGADTGDIISQETIEITYTDDARSLYNKITESECKQIIKITEELERGKCYPQRQDDREGNSWRKRGEKDGIIDWRMSSRAIYNLIRALTKPYVGACFIYGDKKIRVWRAEEIISSQYINIEPGKIIKFNNKHDYWVKAYDNIIHVLDSDEFEGKEGEYL